MCDVMFKTTPFHIKPMPVAYEGTGFTRSCLDVQAHLLIHDQDVFGGIILFVNEDALARNSCGQQPSNGKAWECLEQCWIPGFRDMLYCIQQIVDAKRCLSKNGRSQSRSSTMLKKTTLMSLSTCVCLVMRVSVVTNTDKRCEPVSTDGELDVAITGTIDT